MTDSGILIIYVEWDCRKALQIRRICTFKNTGENFEYMFEHSVFYLNMIVKICQVHHRCFTGLSK